MKKSFIQLVHFNYLNHSKCRIKIQKLINIDIEIKCFGQDKKLQNKRIMLDAAIVCCKLFLMAVHIILMCDINSQLNRPTQFEKMKPKQKAQYNTDDSINVLYAMLMMHTHDN